MSSAASNRSNMQASKPLECGAAPFPALQHNIRHLCLLPDPEEQALLADLLVEVQSEVLPCHSWALGMQCKVLRSMFSSTHRSQWQCGIAAAFRGHDPVAVRLFLCLNYPTGGQACTYGDVGRARAAVAPDCDLQGVVHLANKLDAPMILTACERFLLADKPAFLADSMRWLEVSAACGQQQLRMHCAADSLHALLSSDSGAGDEALQGLGREELLLLLRGTLGAWRETKQRQLEVEVQPLEVWAHTRHELEKRVTLWSVLRGLDGNTDRQLLEMFMEALRPFKSRTQVAPALRVTREQACELLHGNRDDEGTPLKV